jgi:hypothetical protein
MLCCQPCRRWSGPLFPGIMGNRITSGYYLFFLHWTFVLDRLFVVVHRSIREDWRLSLGFRSVLCLHEGKREIGGENLSLLVCRLLRRAMLVLEVVMLLSDVHLVSRLHKLETLFKKWEEDLRDVFSLGEEIFL